MIRLLINALAASAGGGITYVRNFIPQLQAHENVKATVLVNRTLRENLPSGTNINFVEQDAPAGVVARFWYEQRTVPALIRETAANVLLSTGNFAIWNSPVPQILLSRNALYTSERFLQDLKSRGEYKLWIDTEVRRQLAKWSVRRASATVAPSESFAAELSAWTGQDVIATHHGFDRDSFTGDSSALKQDVQQTLRSAESALKLLFVSHYNYYRNFETLFRSLPILKRSLPDRDIRLFLTCKLSRGGRDGAYRTDSAAALIRDLQLDEDIVQFGPVPYQHLHHLYSAVDVYVTAAYAETFAHPLVEAMSSGIPIVAADLPVHREICRDAAIYFPPFSPDRLAMRIVELAKSQTTVEQLRESGLARSKDFSWKIHVERILELAGSLIQGHST